MEDGLSSRALSYEEEVSLDELIKETENSSEFEDTVDAEIHGRDNYDIVVNGILKTQTHGPLEFYEQTIWAGDLTKKFPDPLEKQGFFTIKGNQPKGVGAAVVYNGKNSEDVECGWLLAFTDSDNNGGRKVIVDCGLLTKFENICWDTIEEKLIKFGKTTAIHEDPATGTKVIAKITVSPSGNGCTPDKDKVVATFYC
ncbi:jasmonate-induced protein homolog [Spinacia oleracea]|uniref:Jasmonate-induced protein homolog n=1 Tax=Spinacia oleracea TaxID=3562 RepID=A0A9R0I516_SPIOL|nr:jasmonate-induced protein homolog [Spinacia oleracea]